jgi:hypothetical protein
VQEGHHRFCLEGIEFIQPFIVELGLTYEEDESDFELLLLELGPACKDERIKGLSIEYDVVI